MHPHFYGAMKLSQASYDFISRSLLPAAADERCADANIFTSARNTICIHRHLQRTGILSYHRQQMRFLTRRHASMDASTSSTFMDASARKRKHICADAEVSVNASTAHLYVNASTAHLCAFTDAFTKTSLPAQLCCLDCLRRCPLLSPAYGGREWERSWLSHWCPERQVGQFGS